MLKNWKDFNNNPINEGVSWLDNPKFHEYLKLYKAEIDKNIFELDKIWSRVSLLTVPEILETNLSDLGSAVQNINKRTNDLHRYEINKINNMPESEFEAEWDGVEILAEEFYQKAEDKYNVLDTLIMTLDDIKEIDLSVFNNANNANNSAMIQLDDNSDSEVGDNID